jgi:hypothetical protein
MKKSEAKDANDSGKAKPTKAPAEDRNALLSIVWGKKKITRLNQVISNNYCGRLTVREFAAMVLADRLNFPKGLDTPMCIGDFEGNFCTNVLSVTVGGDKSDHVCVMGDPHGCME